MGSLRKEKGETMAKTDKELTVEVVCSHLAAWGHQTGCLPVKSNELSGLIESVYSTISKLDNE